MPPIPLDHDPIPEDPAAERGFLTPLFAKVPATTGKAELLPGLDLAWTVSLDRATVRADLQVRGLPIWSTTFDADNLSRHFTGNQGLFKEDIQLDVDLAKGEVTLSGVVCVLSPTGWQCHRFPPEVLIAWSPTLGAVGGEILAHPPVITDPVYGTSNSIVPTITRIPVDTVSRIGTPVGSLVKTALFPQAPDFLFNVCFAVGPFLPFLPGAYGDPTSPWFNVFAGYYEIDCPKPAWDRPFGYRLTTPTPTVDFDEVLRIGKADWNFFSNWMYGVPKDIVDLYVPPDPGVRTEHLGRRTIAQSTWDLVDIDGFSAVTAYESNAEGAARLVENTPLTPAWRLTYGEPRPRSEYTKSFPGASMRAQLYMAFSEDETMFRTYLFGGTVNKTFDGPPNAGLLERQMAAVAEVMTAHYPALGFPLPST